MNAVWKDAVDEKVDVVVSSEPNVRRMCEEGCG